MTKECNELGEMERVNLSLHTSSALFTFLSSDSWGEARPFGPPVPGHDGRTMRGTESVTRWERDREVGCYAHSFSPFITQPPVPSALSLRHRLMNRRIRRLEPSPVSDRRSSFSSSRRYATLRSAAVRR